MLPQKIETGRSSIPLKLDHLDLELDSTVLVIDSTKMKTYMDCPRKFFYNYVLGWTGKAPSLALEFGSAWHVAMEELLKGLKDHGSYTNDDLATAYKGFYDYLAPIFDPKIMGPSMAPKDYASAMQALVLYQQRYAHENFIVHYTEISGSIPIAEGRELYFRLDAACENDRGMFALEHKTTSRMERNWTEQWNLSIQIGTYTHVLYCLWGADRAWGVMINGAVFRKSGQDFARLPIMKNKDMMQVWLETVNHYYGEILDDLDRLATLDSRDAQTMKSFPMNTESCTKYGVCPYHNLCSVWANPLQNLHRRPMEFTTKHWDPRTLDENAEVVMRGGKLEEKKGVSDGTVGSASD